ncbi:MAG: hypothetical protein MHM6MM_003731 [Cercozoa sp. M6MM]
MHAIDEIDLVLLDMDGVVWRSHNLLPRARETIEALRSKGIRVGFVTNSSKKSRISAAQQLTKLGIPTDKSDCFTSAWSAAQLLRRRGFHPDGSRPEEQVLVIGSSAMEEELTEAKVPFTHIDVLLKEAAAHESATGDDDDDLLRKSNATVHLTRNQLAHVDLLDRCGGVLMGYDNEFTYSKLALMVLHLHLPRVDFFATNLDSTFPVNNGRLLAGTGAMFAAAAVASDKRPINSGKPEKDFAVSVLEHFGVLASRTLMVGDRLDTDVLFGKHSGMRTALVLTGVCNQEDADNAGEASKPDFVLNGLADLEPLALSL